MKTVVIVAPHFLPGFLPSVHRSRLWAYHLAEFGWNPVILATDPAYYECQVLPEMLDLLPPGLEVIRTRALPVKPVRVIGDIGIRSIYWYWRALSGLARSRQIDFLLFTIPASVPALLGPFVYRKFGIPYGIDYIDPWIPETPQHHRPYSKEWFAERVSRILEPIAVRDARLITGINEAYFESVLRRHPHLDASAITAGMPYGGSERDYEALDRRPRKLSLFDPADGLVHMIYAGALLPKAFEVLDSLLAGVALMQKADPQRAARLRIHFVGTGVNESDPGSGHTVKPYIEKHGVAGIVSELPSRIGYLDVLNHLRHASSILVIGSTEPHYSPSKIYQAFMSQRPVFALLHEDSTAVATLRQSRAGQVVTFNESRMPDAGEMRAALEHFLSWAAGFDASAVDSTVFESVTARETTRVLAKAMDSALELERSRSGLT